MLAFLHYVKTADNLHLDNKLLVQFQNTHANHQILNSTFTIRAFPDFSWLLAL